MFGSQITSETSKQYPHRVASSKKTSDPDFDSRSESRSRGPVLREPNNHTRLQPEIHKAIKPQTPSHTNTSPQNSTSRRPTYRSCRLQHIIGTQLFRPQVNLCIVFTQKTVGSDHDDEPDPASVHLALSSIAARRGSFLSAEGIQRHRATPKAEPHHRCARRARESP